MVTRKADILDVKEMENGPHCQHVHLVVWIQHLASFNKFMYLKIKENSSVECQPPNCRQNRLHSEKLMPGGGMMGIISQQKSMHYRPTITVRQQVGEGYVFSTVSLSAHRDSPRAGVGLGHLSIFVDGI